jgi:DNA repair protein RecO (recombination protein O)
MEKIHAIVIHHTPYKENSCIAQLYTAEFGRINVVVHGMKGKQSKSAILQPLFILDIVVQTSKSSELYSWKEGQLSFPLTQIPFDVKKRSICLFLAEFLSRCVREKTPNEALFSFLKNAVQLLDCMQDGVENFHLFCMANCIKYLGFSPMFAEQAPDCIRYFSALSAAELGKIPLSRFQRQEMIQSMLAYLSEHLGMPITFKSLPVLEELFS